MLPQLMKPKKKRTILSDFQKKKLKTFFEEKQYINTEENDRIADLLNLPPLIVQKWFQNRRAREKEAKLQSGSEDNSSSPKAIKKLTSAEKAKTCRKIKISQMEQKPLKLVVKTSIAQQPVPILPAPVFQSTNCSCHCTCGSRSQAAPAYFYANSCYCPPVEVSCQETYNFSNQSPLPFFSHSSLNSPSEPQAQLNFPFRVPEERHQVICAQPSWSPTCQNNTLESGLASGEQKKKENTVAEDPFLDSSLSIYSLSSEDEHPDIQNLSPFWSPQRELEDLIDLPKGISWPLC